MAVYPGAIPTIPGNGTWTHDQVGDEIEAIAGTLGVNPHLPRTTVAEKLAMAARDFVVSPTGMVAADNWWLQSAVGYSNTAVTDKTVRIMPVINPVQFTTTLLDFTVTAAGSAGSTFTPVIYNTNSDGTIGSLILEGPASPADAAAAVAVTVPATAIPAGLLWMGGYSIHTGTAPQYRCTSNTQRYFGGYFRSNSQGYTAVHSGYVTNVTAENKAPATWPAPGWSSAGTYNSDRYMPYIFVRVDSV